MKYYVTILDRRNNEKHEKAFTFNSKRKAENWLKDFNKSGILYGVTAYIEKTK